MRDLRALAKLRHLDVEHRERVLDQRDVEVFLGAKVQIDCANRQLRCTSDELDGSACVPALRENRASSFLDASTTSLSLLGLAFLSVRHGADVVSLTRWVKRVLVADDGFSRSN